MAVETIKIIKGMEVSYLIDKGFGKFVYSIIVDNTNYILDDNDIQAFSIKADYYKSKISVGDKSHQNRTLAKEYRQMYERLISICNDRKCIEEQKVVYYPTMWDYHLNYNDSFAQNKLGGLRYGI